MRERALISPGRAGAARPCGRTRLPAPAGQGRTCLRDAPGRTGQPFWRGFADPVLDALIADAVSANADARLAQARLREVRARWPARPTPNRLPASRWRRCGARQRARLSDRQLPQRLRRVQLGARLRPHAPRQRIGGGAGAGGRRRACWRVQRWSAPSWRRSTWRCARCSSAWWWRRRSLANQRETQRIVKARAELSRSTPADDGAPMRWSRPRGPCRRCRARSNAARCASPR